MSRLDEEEDQEEQDLDPDDRRKHDKDPRSTWSEGDCWELGISHDGRIFADQPAACRVCNCTAQRMPRMQLYFAGLESAVAQKAKRVGVSRPTRCTVHG